MHVMIMFGYVAGHEVNTANWLRMNVCIYILSESFHYIEIAS